MLKYVVALLCGASLSGSVYMAGWGSLKCAGQEDACCVPNASSSVMTPVSLEGKIDIGNTKCIVMADDVTTRTVEYQGKIYHICCSDCAATFNKDPEKYIKALEADPVKYGVPKKDK